MPLALFGFFEISVKSVPTLRPMVETPLEGSFFLEPTNSGAFITKTPNTPSKHPLRGPEGAAKADRLHTYPGNTPVLSAIVHGRVHGRMCTHLSLFSG